jgi:hypothetical protein
MDVCQTINAMENPELVQKLVAGDINIFKCAGCGHEAHIQLPLLFNDYRVGVKILYYPDPWITGWLTIPRGYATTIWVC